MKLLITMGLLLISNTIQAGNWSSGGGDPIEVKAKQFPRKNLY
jgi:hypothetical protein